MPYFCLTDARLSVAGKIGLLPKRPVSLVNVNDESQPRRAHVDEDEEELEYVENPFEEGRYS